MIAPLRLPSKTRKERHIFLKRGERGEFYSGFFPGWEAHRES